jgi:DNA-binding response OmpR family regulator
MKTLLILEDNQDDLFLLQHAVKKTSHKLNCLVFTSGEDAVRYLFRQGKYSDLVQYPLPDFILLDLKVTGGADGFEVLSCITSKAKVRLVPVLIMSSSAAECDVAKAYELGANAYHVKPTSLDELVRVLDLLFTYWKLPLKPTPPSGRLLEQTKEAARSEAPTRHFDSKALHAG